MSDPASTKRKYTRLDSSKWAEIEALWETGDATLQDLEERFGVSRRALQSHFSKHGTIKGGKAEEMAAAVKDKIFSETLSNTDETTARAKATREVAYKNAVIVEELIMAQLSAAQKDPSQALKAASALKALSLAAAGLERIHALKWKALGLDKNSFQSDELPVLVIQDLTAEEIKAMQEGHQEEDDDDGQLEALEDDQQEEKDEIVVIDTKALEPRPTAPSSVLPDGSRLVRGVSI